MNMPRRCHIADAIPMLRCWPAAVAALLKLLLCCLAVLPSYAACYANGHLQLVGCCAAWPCCQAMPHAMPMVTCSWSAAVLPGRAAKLCRMLCQWSPAAGRCRCTQWLLMRAATA
eukprot:TRINITY_DN19039_c0_g1_i3.p3 TRINITY_DN19039_c0_g1~~TRINITY_DN19039_c0_g1_i3.p3  ORF type:complete len:125 (+),score=24.00 TRINITY_DN19039_c0_g1_i3:33-377(+)